MGRRKQDPHADHHPICKSKGEHNAIGLHIKFLFPILNQTYVQITFIENRCYVLIHNIVGINARHYGQLNYYTIVGSKRIQWNPDIKYLHITFFSYYDVMIFSPAP